MNDMYEIIKSMVDQANKEKNYDLIEYVEEIIIKFADTMNCPYNWRDIGERLAEEYDPDSWVYEELGLWNYKEE